jgi:putative DNA-invertase from lambdoid prophage Rac
VSGVSTKLAERPEGRRLLDLLRCGDTLVVRWIDRLGRNYQDICETIREFMQRGVVIQTVINGITLDGATKEPMQCAVRDALIAFMAATAQAQAEATKEAQRAGIAHAKTNGDARAYKGRKPSYSRKQLESAQAMLGKSSSVGAVAKTMGLTRQTIYRINPFRFWFRTRPPAPTFARSDKPRACCLILSRRERRWERQRGLNVRVAAAQ